MMNSINIFVPNIAEAVDFYRDVFDAVVTVSNEDYAKFYVNDFNFVMVKESQAVGTASAKTLGKSPLCFQLAVFNLKYSVERAEEKGVVFRVPSSSSKPIFQIEDALCSNIECPAGIAWSLVTEE